MTKRLSKYSYENSEVLVPRNEEEKITVEKKGVFVTMNGNFEVEEIKLNEESDEYSWFNINNLPRHRVEDNIPEIREFAIKSFSEK